MKRIKLLTLYLALASSGALHAMDDRETDLGLRRLFQEETESSRAPLPRVQTPTRRTPLQNITGSQPRAGTPVLASRPNAPRAGTQRQAAPTTTINALLAARERGEFDDAELGRRIRLLFPRRIPTPRSERENESPQHPNILSD